MAYRGYILKEKIWFAWSKSFSKTSYSGDKWRCYLCGTTKNDKQRKIGPLIQNGLLEGWVLQLQRLNDKSLFSADALIGKYRLMQLGKSVGGGGGSFHGSKLDPPLTFCSSKFKSSHLHCGVMSSVDMLSDDISITPIYYSDQTKQKHCQRHNGPRVLIL